MFVGTKLEPRGCYYNSVGDLDLVKGKALGIEVKG
jgi:hypothetical protein